MCSIEVRMFFLKFSHDTQPWALYTTHKNLNLDLKTKFCFKRVSQLALLASCKLQKPRRTRTSKWIESSEGFHYCSKVAIYAQQPLTYKSFNVRWVPKFNSLLCRNLQGNVPLSIQLLGNQRVETYLCRYNYEGTRGGEQITSCEVITLVNYYFTSPSERRSKGLICLISYKP